MQRHGDGPVYSQSALGRCRGIKGKLVTMAAISSRLSVRVPQRSLNNRNPEGDGIYSLVCQGSYSGRGGLLVGAQETGLRRQAHDRTGTRFLELGTGPKMQRSQKKSDRTEGQPVGEMNSPQGVGQGCSCREMPTAASVQPFSGHLSCGLEDPIPDHAQEVCDQEHRSDANLNCNQIHVFLSFC
jgi:hypothetical protein